MQSLAPPGGENHRCLTISPKRVKLDATWLSTKLAAPNHPVQDTMLQLHLRLNSDVSCPFLRQAYILLPSEGLLPLEQSEQERLCSRDP